MYSLGQRKGAALVHPYKAQPLRSDWSGAADIALSLLERGGDAMKRKKNTVPALARMGIDRDGAAQ